jgi:hypothetical protein
MRWFLPICLIASSGSSIANPLPPIMLIAHAHGSSLELVFRNDGGSQLTLPINSAGYDDRLSIHLVSKHPGVPPLDYKFREPRDKPAVRTTTLRPKATYTETIDLVAGALRGNVDPPPPGEYDVNVFWNDRAGALRFEIDAVTTIAIPAAIEGPCTSPPASTGIELLGRQVTPGGTVEIGLHNTSTASICVAARLEAGGPQNDWLTIKLDDALGKSIRTIGFTAPRRGTALITAELAPGATTWQRWDLAAWAKRSSSPLAPGLVYAVATYDSAKLTTEFHGTLTTRFAVNVR